MGGEIGDTVGDIDRPFLSEVRRPAPANEGPRNHVGEDRGEFLDSQRESAARRTEETAAETVVGTHDR